MVLGPNVQGAIERAWTHDYFSERYPAGTIIDDAYAVLVEQIFTKGDAGELSVLESPCGLSVVSCMPPEDEERRTILAAHQQPDDTHLFEVHAYTKYSHGEACSAWSVPTNKNRVQRRYPANNSLDAVINDLSISGTWRTVTLARCAKIMQLLCAAPGVSDVLDPNKRYAKNRLRETHQRTDGQPPSAPELIFLQPPIRDVVRLALGPNT